MVCLLSFDLNNLELITTKKHLASWTKRLDKSKSFCCDTETTGLDAMAVDLVGVAVAVEEAGKIEGAYIPVGHHEELGRQLSYTETLYYLAPLIKTKQTVWHNAAYDMLVLGQPRYGVEFGSVHDSMFMAYALFGDQLPSQGMDYLSERFLGHKTIKFSDVVLNRPGRHDFRDVPLPEACQYAAEDTVITLALAKLFQQALKDQGLWEVYNRDRQLLHVQYDMKSTGVKVNGPKLLGLGNEWLPKLCKLRDEAQKIAGWEFNLGSPLQVKQVFQERGLDLPVDRKTGKESTDKAALERLAGDPLVDILLEHRKLSKLKSAFVDALPKKIRTDTGRVHPDHKMTRTVTGRLACADPNTQQIPTRTPEGKSIKEAFIEDPGYKLWCLDYSQIELRVAAHVSEDPVLAKAYLDDLDVHSLTASTIRGLPLDQVTDDQRSVAKTANFLVLYGGREKRLAQQAKIGMDEAWDFLQEHERSLARFYEWKEEAVDIARQQGCVYTIFGRRVPLPFINSKDREKQSHNERLAISGIIQGSAADLIRFGMVKTRTLLKANPKWGAMLLLQVHDELVGRAKTAYVDVCADEVQKVMITAADDLVKWKVPIKSSKKTGFNWKEAK